MKELIQSLNMNNSLAVALEKEGITTPTGVQKKVIPEALKNRDLVVQSETGTGKTLAYLLPLYQKLDPEKKEMQALVLAPTHELAMQILRQIERLSLNSEIKVTTTSAIGNVNIERQIEKLREKPHVIVGTPGRVVELIRRKKISAHTIKSLIIDEADTLLDGDNGEIVKAIVKSTPRDRQLIMVSATISRNTELCAHEMMKDPGFISETGSASVPSQIEHIYIQAEQRDKIEVLRKAVGVLKPTKAIVFIGDRDNTEECASKLLYHGLKVAAMHGHTDKVERKRAIDDFKDGKVQLLITSDLAARGLHIEGVTHVFNVNMPEKSKDYLHRVGRTGRKGLKGMAVSIATERELQFIWLYEKELHVSIWAKDLYKGSVVEAKGK